MFNRERTSKVLAEIMEVDHIKVMNAFRFLDENVGFARNVIECTFVFSDSGNYLEKIPDSLALAICLKLEKVEAFRYWVINTKSLTLIY